jgi:hypothetical protein
MEIVEVQALTYSKSIAESTPIFNSAKFSELNKDKIEALHYLLFKDTKIRLGIILGVKGFNVSSPFSAPFGGFSLVQSEVKSSVILQAVELLEKWLVERKYKSITISLPPLRYEQDFYTRIVNSLFIKGYQTKQLDVNHQFEIPADFESDYPTMLQRNARKNLNVALKSELTWHVIPQEHAQRAYEVIAINRSARNKPLRMAFEQVLNMASITPAQFFVVQFGDIDIASAIVFQVNSKVVQVIYWGDDPQYSELRAMNFLSYKLFQYYAEQKIEVVDIGISTEHSIPNFGLCDFKESIGCSVSLKYTFSKEL